MFDISQINSATGRTCQSAHPGYSLRLPRSTALAAMTLALLAVSVTTFGCEDAGRRSGSSSPDASPGARRDDSGDPYSIVVTTGMIADIVEQVAGEQAEVSSLMKQGVDPHLYKPTRSDVVALSNADVIFYNGLMLEGKMVDVFVSQARTGKPVHAVTELIESDFVMTDARDHYDPHVWMDVRGWGFAVDAVAAALSEFDPANAAEYRANATEYAVQLDQLDAYVRAAISSIPESKRVLITAHDAFGYFGRAYGIEVRGIQGISTESEAGVRDINELVDFIVERGISAVFVETSVADKNVRALVEGAKARGHEISIGGSLYSDAMGAEGAYEGTYIGMIDHNATTITRALGGRAPANGFREWRDGDHASTAAPSGG